MIVTRDRTEGFALRAFAAARRAKKEKGLVSHHDEIAYTAKTAGSTSIVIYREVEGSRGIILRFCNGIFRPRKLSGLKMTKRSPRRDLHSPVAHADRSARSRQSEQRLCNRDQAQRFFPAKISCRADAQ